MIPVQIIGTQRSGSNLLRLMISQLDGVFAPHPPHILKEFSPLISAYGNLQNNAIFNELVSDICEYVSLNPVPWLNSTLNSQTISKHCEGRSLFHIFKSIYESNAREHHAAFWFCKSMQNVHFIEVFKKSGFNPYYIHLVRDGRDVALSFKKAVVGEKHIYHLAKKWQLDQESSWRYVKEFGTERAIQVRYEDLLISPDKEIGRICKLIGLEYSDRILDYYHSEESILTAASGEMWQNLKRPIIKNNFGKYKSGLSEEDISIFETVASNTLQKLGYNLYLNLNGRDVDISIEHVQQFDILNAEMKLEMIQKTRNSDLIKRQKQELLIKEIKSRKGIPV